MNTSAHELKELQTITASELLSVARKGNLVYIDNIYVSPNNLKELSERAGIGNLKRFVIDRIADANAVSKRVYCSFINLFNNEKPNGYKQIDDETGLTYFLPITKIDIQFISIMSSINLIPHSIKGLENGVRFHFSGNEITEDQRMYIKELFAKYL